MRSDYDGPMETKTETPELTRDLIDKAAAIDVWFVLGTLEAVALADPECVTVARDSAARVLTGYVERNQ